MQFDAEKVLAALRQRSLKGRKQMTVKVGYQAEYAVYQHENLEYNHPNGGQAKFLELPMRQHRKEMLDIVRRSVEAKNGLEEGLFRAGHFLIDQSLPLVPVDTGHLRDSWFVEVTEGDR